MTEKRQFIPLYLHFPENQKKPPASSRHDGLHFRTGFARVSALQLSLSYSFAAFRLCSLVVDLLFLAGAILPFLRSSPPN
jgi:hypothetical protein